MINRVAELFTDYRLLLEILNGGAITPELMWLVLLSVYLVREAKRRGLHFLDWFHLPPSMNLILAIYICDLGVVMRSVTVWTWRRFGSAADFTLMQSWLLIIGGGLIVLGTLCKIRAITAPDHGDGPWFVAGALTLLVAAILVFAR